MNRIYTWAAVAALALAGAVGCQQHGGPDNGGNLPPGENGTRAGGNGAFGSDVAQPGEGVHGNMNGTGSNGPAGNGTH